MRKAIMLTAFYHLLCLAAVILGEPLHIPALQVGGLVADMIGAVICPIALAVTAGIIGIRDNSSVLKLYPGAAAVTGAVGLARGLIFAFSISSGMSNLLKEALPGFAGAMRYLLISFIILTVWFIIFELTRFMMNRPSKYNRLGKKR